MKKKIDKWGPAAGLFVRCGNTVVDIKDINVVYEEEKYERLLPDLKLVMATDDTNNKIQASIILGDKTLKTWEVYPKKIHE